jgi:hypothetical protein
VVPKLVPCADRVADVVPKNPTVTQIGHSARHVRVVAFRLLPSGVVLYAGAELWDADNIRQSTCSSGRQPEDHDITVASAR